MFSTYVLANVVFCHFTSLKANQTQADVLCCCCWIWRRKPDDTQTLMNLGIPDVNPDRPITVTFGEICVSLCPQGKIDIRQQLLWSCILHVKLHHGLGV